MAVVAGFIGGMFSFGSTVAVLGAGSVGAAWAGAGFASTILGGLAVKLLTTVAVSALTSALAPDPAQGGGITISSTIRGEENPETIILGKYATAGQAICAAYSHGRSDRFLTQVIELCSAPGATLERVMIGDEWVELSDELHPFFGHPVAGENNGLVWVKYYDGTQTEADPYLLDRYGSHPDRPWTADMVGAGICYAIMTFGWYREDQTSVPPVRFELGGIPLYDPRKDSSAGGVGAHRLADPTTWEQTENAAVIGWNVMRGIPLPGGEVWGGNITNLTELPWAVWTAAMNRCDAPIERADGSTEPAYRAGIEVALDQPPAAALEEIFKACSAVIADMGYGWGIVVGAPALPVYSFGDDDVIVSKSQELDPFPGIEETYNAVTARYPDPEALYETKEAPRRTNAGWEAADAFGRRMANLALPAVPYALQVQRLMEAWIKDERRFRRHIINLPPDSAHVELIDTVDWSSARNGYVGKDFSVYEILEDPRTGVRQMSIRERDPLDYSWEPGFELPSTPTPPGTTPPAPESVSGFAVQAITINDAAGGARRPAIALSWASDILAAGLRWEIRHSGQTQAVLRGTTQDVGAGGITIAEGVLPDMAYEVRARLIASRRTVWTAWAAVATDTVRLGRDDIAEDILEDIAGLLDWASGTEAELTALVADLEAESARVDGIVQGVRDDLASEVTALELAIAAGLTSANNYTQTAISTYDLTVQGRFSAMAGQIEELTAALTSDTLIQNGSFTAGASYWTMTSASVIAREGSSNALVLAAPDTHLANVGVSSTGSVAQPLIAFEVAADDRLQIRFSAASAASSRNITVSAAWRDASGAALGSPSTQALTLAPANTWQVLSVQFDPPDDAVGAVLTISKTQTGAPVLVTKVSAETVNVAIIARIAALEAARVTDQDALALYKTQVNTRFGNADAAVTAESTARSNADIAIGNRIDAVEAVNATQTASITAQSTAIATATEAIAQLDERLAVQYGGTQLVRDPDFARGLDFWGGALGDLNSLVPRNRASGGALQHDMPGVAAFTIAAGASGFRVTDTIPVSSADRYDLGGYVFRGQADSPNARIYVQWLNESNAAVGSISDVVGDPAPQAWVYFGATGLAPPTGATRARVVFAAMGGSAGLAAVTGITLTREAAYEVRSSAEIAEVKQAQADADSAFASYRSALDVTLAGLDGRVTANATGIADRYTRAQTDNAISAAVNSVTASLQPQINQRATTTALNALTARVSNTETGLSAVSDSITQVSSRVNDASASGLMRVQSWAAPTGSAARIAITATAGHGGTPATAALFVEARSDGSSRVSVVASRFAIVSDALDNPGSRTVPFYVANNRTYIDTAVIHEASIGKLHIGHGEIVGGYTATLSGSNTDWDTNREIARFVINLPEACRGLFVFECTAIDRNDATAGCSVVVQLNGATVRRSQSTVTGPAGQTPIKSMARSSVAVNLAAGVNVVRLWGNNINNVTYLFDAFAFQR